MPKKHPPMTPAEVSKRLEAEGWTAARARATTWFSPRPGITSSSPWTWAAAKSDRDAAQHLPGRGLELGERLRWRPTSR